MTIKIKTSKQMERHFKGIANHYRIDILLLIGKVSDITVEKISEQLDANIKTISQHTRYLVQAGLINKHYSGRTVQQSLSPYGKIFLQFIKKFQKTN